MIGKALPMMLVLCAALCLSTAAYGQNVPVFRVMEGDDPAWSDPEYDDTHWPETALNRLRPENPVLWLRARVKLEEELFARSRPVGVRFMALASCELFWNGSSIGTNGIVGRDPQSEQPGRLDWTLALPPDVGPGEHTLALRCSTHHRGFEPLAGFYGLWIGDLLELASLGHTYTALTLVSAGGLLAIGLFFSMTFLLGRRSLPHLWLGLFAIAAGILVIVESLRVLVGYTYDWHIWRLLAVTALSWAVNGLLMIFVTGRFPLAGRRGFLGIGFVLTVLCLFAPGFDAKAAGLHFVGLLASLIWALRALMAGRFDAGFATVGLSLCLVVGMWRQEQFLDFYLFFALGLLCLFLLASHVLAGARGTARA